MSDFNKEALFKAGKAIQRGMKSAGGDGVTFSELARIGIEIYNKTISNPGDDIKYTLIAALQGARATLAHDVPSDCWATGPLTGDPVEDLIVCPGCRAINRIDNALSKVQP